MIIKVMFILFAFISIQGCLPEDDSPTDEPVRVESVIGTDGREYTTSQYECIDFEARVTVESEGAKLYAGNRSCAHDRDDYSLDYLDITLYEIKDRDDVARLNIRSQSYGQLCVIGDVLITFRDGVHDPLTVVGVVSCVKHLADISVPLGDYWATIEFFGYIDVYRQGHFHVTPNNLEHL